MLINTIVISMQMLNFGIGGSVFKSIAFHTGLRNEQAKNELINSALSITILLFGLCIVVATLLAYLVYFHNLLHVTPAFRLICARGILLSGIIVGFKFMEQVFTNYFKGLEQFNKAVALSSGNKLSALLINMIILAIFGGDIIQLLTVIIILNLVFFFVSLRLLGKSAPNYTYRFRPRLPRQDARFALLIWLQAFAFLFIFQSDRYLVVNYFGLAILSYYALTATIFNHLHMGLNALLPWLSPKLTKRLAQNMDNMELFLAARNMVATCSFLLLTILYIIYPFLFKAILGVKTFTAMDAYVPYFIIFELFFSLGIVPTYYFNALGHEKRFLYFVIIFMLSSLSAMLISLHIFHTPSSLLYGLIGSCFANMILLNMLLNYTMHQKPRILQSVILMLPALFIALLILSSLFYLKIIFVSAGLIALYFVNIKGSKHQFKLLVHSW
jgi:O-antigen/teichoic acid export membrane protein